MPTDAENTRRCTNMTKTKLFVPCLLSVRAGGVQNVNNFGPLSVHNSGGSVRRLNAALMSTTHR